MPVIRISRQVKLIQINRTTPQKIQEILFRLLALKRDKNNLKGIHPVLLRYPHRDAILDRISKCSYRRHVSLPLSPRAYAFFVPLGGGERPFGFTPTFTGRDIVYHKTAASVRGGFRIGNSTHYRNAFKLLCRVTNRYRSLRFDFLRSTCRKDKAGLRGKALFGDR